MIMLPLAVIFAARSANIADRYTKTRTLPPKRPVPTPVPEVTAGFSFTFVPEDLPDDQCAPCPKCVDCPDCPTCQPCPKCPPPPKCQNCVVCPTPCPPCEECPPCPSGKVTQSESVNGATNRLFFFELL